MAGESLVLLGARSRLGPVGSARWSAAVTVRLHSAAPRRSSLNELIPHRRDDLLTGRDGTTSRVGNCTCNLSILRPNLDTLVCARFIYTPGRFETYIQYGPK